MVVHVSSISLPSHIPSGLVADLAPDARETNAVMGGQTPVSPY